MPVGQRTPLRCSGNCWHSCSSPGPAARWIAPSTPPPPRQRSLAALTMASPDRTQVSMRVYRQVDLVSAWAMVDSGTGAHRTSISCLSTSLCRRQKQKRGSWSPRPETSGAQNEPVLRANQHRSCSTARGGRLTHRTKAACHRTHARLCSAREIRQPLQKSGGNTREQSHLHLRKGKQQWQSSAC